MTTNIFEYIKQTRNVFITLVEELDEEALNTVPIGFRNNIAWNFGHIVVSTLGLCYRRTGVIPDQEIPFVARYAKGTKPEERVTMAEIALLKVQALESVEQIEADYTNGLFARITPYATSTYGIEMDTIEKVLTASLAHDNMHLGYAMALKNIINEQKSQLHK